MAAGRIMGTMGSAWCTGPMGRCNYVIYPTAGAPNSTSTQWSMRAGLYSKHISAERDHSKNIWQFDKASWWACDCLQGVVLVSPRPPPVPQAGAPPLWWWRVALVSVGKSLNGVRVRHHNEANLTFHGSHLLLLPSSGVALFSSTLAFFCRGFYQC